MIIFCRVASVAFDYAITEKSGAGCTESKQAFHELQHVKHIKRFLHYSLDTCSEWVCCEYIKWC